MSISRFIILLTFISSGINLIAQESKIDYQIYFHSLLKGHPLIFTNGGAFAVNYNFVEKERVKIGIQTELGVYREKDVEVNYTFAPLINYNFSLNKKLSIGYVVGPTLIGRDHQFKRVFCDIGGCGEVRSFYIRPHIGGYIKYEIYKNSIFEISGIARGETIRWNKSYSKKWNEGFKFGYSTGLALRFLK